MKLIQHLCVALGLLAASIPAMADVVVKGTVTDPSGEPVVAAGVVEAGTTNGVVTDLYGKYTITDPDGTKTDMTSYKPGMWVDASGKSCTWDKGTAFWQWYVWGGKKDKSGKVITYDGDPNGTGANQGRFMVGMHPDRVAAAKGKTITFKNKIAANGTSFDFIITYKYH